MQNEQKGVEKIIDWKPSHIVRYMESPLRKKPRCSPISHPFTNPTTSIAPREPISTRGVPQIAPQSSQEKKWERERYNEHCIPCDPRPRQARVQLGDCTTQSGFRPRQLQAHNRSTWMPIRLTTMYVQKAGLRHENAGCQQERPQFSLQCGCHSII